MEQMRSEILGAARRIKENWQRVSPGDCKMFSEALGKVSCICPRCDADRLLALNALVQALVEECVDMLDTGLREKDWYTVKAASLEFESLMSFLNKGKKNEEDQDRGSEGEGQG